ncbi:MAG: hypothetical protein E7325_07280 [Clostridiales bacterium]|nr:hypothetical protein [Clostridiales bacterium]
MSKKGKKDWVIEDWDDSLDGKKESYPAIRKIEETGTDDWDLPDNQSPEKKEKRTFKKKPLIISLSAGFVVLLGIFVIVYSGNQNDWMHSTASVIPTETSFPDPGTPGCVSSTPIHIPDSTPDVYRSTPTPKPVTPTPRPITPTPSPEPAASLFRNNPWYPEEMRYYYQFLTDHEKTVYEQIYNGIAVCSPSIQISHSSGEELKKIWEVLYSDCPEFFHLRSCRYTSGTFMPEYRMDKSTYDRKCAAILQRLNGLRVSSSDQFDQQLTIYKDLIDHCEYLAAGDDSTAYADAALYEGRSQCSGYAAALSLGLRHYGIESLMMTGPDHAWNIVRINGKWYNCDATWDDPLEYTPYTSDPTQQKYVWMNMPDRLYSLNPNHVRDSKPFPLPSCDSLDDSYVMRYGYYIPGGTSDIPGAINQAVQSAISAGKEYALIMVDDQRFARQWTSIRDKLYKKYNLYDWAFYEPSEMRCTYALPASALQ